MLVILYFLTLNTQGILLNSKTLVTYINISSLVFLIIAITMFEMGYRKNKAKMFVYGIEYLVLAVVTLLIRHIPKTYEFTMKEYTETIVYVYIAYYIIKSGIQYTIKKHNELKELSDIKEIVKDEPTKKETKRKNKKVESVEEGN